ncbi:DUF500-domain-containing protein [Backusella circina FSU 941]|nr:DUF500-domain-containing protein [Backusella circina FSU 941]
MPSKSELESDTQRAVQILQLFTNPNQGRDVQMLIPPSVLKNAHGIVLIRLVRVGLMISAKSGTGVIIARLPDGSWSAPSGVSISSLGFGHQAGGEVIDSIIVMNYRAAVKAFFDGGGQFQLGVNASLAAGPYGRAAEIAASASSASHIAATYSYSSSKGLYAGYSMEGSKISERVNTNRTFYGRPITAREILTGDVQPPAMATPLYQILESLGAGPRQGLPFAPKKSIVRPPFSQQAPPPPPTTPRPDVSHYKNQAFEEPPPPYSENSNAAASTSTPHQGSSFPQDIKQQQALFNNIPYEPIPANAVIPYNSTSNNRDNDIKKQPPQQQEQMTVVVARYDYHGPPTDLSFSAGDTIIVIKRLGDRESWWEGEIGDKRGYFPANYTEDLEL